MIETRSHIEWNLTYEGEPMLSPVFESFEQCQTYIAQAPLSHDGKYQIISRIVVTQRTDWAVWR